MSGSHSAASAHLWEVVEALVRGPGHPVTSGSITVVGNQKLR
jgi:hypothetical protein